MTEPPRSCRDTTWQRYPKNVYVATTSTSKGWRSAASGPSDATAPAGWKGVGVATTPKEGQRSNTQTSQRGRARGEASRERAGRTSRARAPGGEWWLLGADDLDGRE